MASVRPLGNSAMIWTSSGTSRVCAPAPDEFANFTLRDRLSGFHPAFRRSALRADLEDFSGALDRVGNLKGFPEVSGHWLLAINVFARFHRLNRNPGVPHVVRGD